MLCPRLYWLAARPACFRQPSRCRLKPIRLKCWVVCLIPSFRIANRPVICRFGKIDWLQPIAANPAQCSLCLFFYPHTCAVCCTLSLTRASFRCLQPHSTIRSRIHWQFLLLWKFYLCTSAAPQAQALLPSPSVFLHRSGSLVSVVCESQQSTSESDALNDVICKHTFTHPVGCQGTNEGSSRPGGRGTQQQQQHGTTSDRPSAQLNRIQPNQHGIRDCSSHQAAPWRTTGR